MDCIFCKIVAGEITCEKLYEDEHCLAFLDVRPSTKGHSLVIPKKHFDDWLDTPENVLAEISRVSKIVAKAAIKGLDADGFNIWVNTKKAAGQVVMHTHLHVLPRYLNDGLKMWSGKEISTEDFKKTGSALREAIE